MGVRPVTARQFGIDPPATDFGRWLVRAGAARMDAPVCHFLALESDRQSLCTSDPWGEAADSAAWCVRP
jgi:hypothetical protein